MRVSVIIPTLNAGAWIVPLLESLRTQSRRPDEVLVVDSDSADGTAALARQLDRVLDPVRAARHRRDILGILAGGQQFGQNRAELHLAQNAAGLDAGKHLFQPAHIGGQRLHLAQALVHLLELGADGA